jgi:hypothetical protein
MPTSTTLTVSSVLDHQDLTRQAPPPAGTELVAAFAMTAATPGGTSLTTFDQPVALQFELPATSVPAGATADNVVLAFWDGQVWVELPTVVTTNADGDLVIHADTTHFTLFALLVNGRLSGAPTPPARAASPASTTATLMPAPAVRGISLAVWSGGTVESMARAYPSIRSVWMSGPDGTLIGFIVGAPTFVNEPFNAVTKGTIRGGSAVIVVRGRVRRRRRS